MFSGLNRKQKEAVGLLSIGTFLEYFDLMLYVHMAVLLNVLFFPETDPLSARLLAAFAFCSTFIFRPFGALFFGWLGDNIGRRSTVVITTFMMSISCLIMALLPTYAEIGVTAALMVTLCRIIQGLSSMGEVIGAEIYLTETIRPPAQYPAVAFISVAATLGTMVALGVASLATNIGFNWRYAFVFGACVAFIGSIARTALRETPDFVNAKHKLREAFEKTDVNIKLLKNNPIYQENVNKATAFWYFIIKCSWPACYYFAYVHCGNILKDSFHCTPEAVIAQNFQLSIIHLLSFVAVTCISDKIYPLKILKIRTTIFFIGIIFAPYLLNNYIQSPGSLFLLQIFIVVFATDNMPAVPLFLRHFPVFRRFTCAGFTYALSRALMYIITSFGIVYLVDYCGNWGLLILMIPLSLGFALGIRHFEKLERIGGYYPEKKDSSCLKSVH